MLLPNKLALKKKKTLQTSEHTFLVRLFHRIPNVLRWRLRSGKTGANWSEICDDSKISCLL